MRLLSRLGLIGIVLLTSLLPMSFETAAIAATSCQSEGHHTRAHSTCQVPGSGLEGDTSANALAANEPAPLCSPTGEVQDGSSVVGCDVWYCEGDDAGRLLAKKSVTAYLVDSAEGGQSLLPQVRQTADPCAEQPSVRTLALNAFFETELVVPPLVAQPAGVTLCNLPTVMHVPMGEVVDQRVINGTPVTLRFTPVRFEWTFGGPIPQTVEYDDTLVTTTPGEPFDFDGAPADLGTTEFSEWVEKYAKVSHRFPKKGTATPSVTVVFSGSISVNGGPAEPVNGSNWATSPTIDITVSEARAELVDPALG